ncbi:hypothetical protein D3C76_338030 [compost metagenome]
MRKWSELGGDFCTAKKRRVFQSYTEGFEIEAVQTYLIEVEGYKDIAELLGTMNCAQ